MEFCVHEVEEHGLEVEGIYRSAGILSLSCFLNCKLSRSLSPPPPSSSGAVCRKPGQGSVIKNMVMEIDKGQFEFEEYGDIHTIGSLLKKFFLELPDTLIPGECDCE